MDDRFGHHSFRCPNRRLFETPAYGQQMAERQAETLENLRHMQVRMNEKDEEIKTLKGELKEAKEDWRDAKASLKDAQAKLEKMEQKVKDLEAGN